MLAGRSLFKEKLCNEVCVVLVAGANGIRSETYGVPLGLLSSYAHIGKY